MTNNPTTSKEKRTQWDFTQTKHHSQNRETIGGGPTEAPIEKPKRTVKLNGGKPTATRKGKPAPQSTVRTLFRDLETGTCSEVITEEQRSVADGLARQDPNRYQLFVGRPLVATVTWNEAA